MVPLTNCHSVDLPTGTLDLTVTNGPALEEFCDFAARANPKRGFLIVSKVLGRHLPARPAAMRATMDDLGAMIPSDLPAPVLFLGMAETATALGQGVFAAFRKLNPDVPAVYLQTSRQNVEGATILSTFEEGHSHATTHLIQMGSDEIAELTMSARSLVIIDDECSTGNTFINAATSIMAQVPTLERIETCCITDWSSKAYLAKMPLPTTGHAILHGEMVWRPGEIEYPKRLATKSNRPGVAPLNGMRSRTGLLDTESASRQAISPYPGERILVLGDGEHSYEALLIAEEIERKGGIAAVQCITRSPAMHGHAMETITSFSDFYGSGAPCYLYNILKHAPDRILIAAEINGDQALQAREGVEWFGGSAKVELIHCTYASGGSI